jgi:hypothetical protein
VARTQQLRTLLFVPLLLGLAAGAYSFRRATIRAFFKDAAPASAPSLTAAPSGTQGLSAVPRVRVVLLDGLGRGVAAQLASLNKACATGADIVIDNGFPTVSLPVQHVLWTGLTQSQSGVLYRIAPLAAPPPLSLAVRVPDSVAVAESHNEIIRSFGFAAVHAPVGLKAVTTEELAWRSHGFVDAARTAVASAASLAFIHILRVDEAGHAEGADSELYDRAAQTSDALLAELLSAERDRQNTRWFVLSDHGHRAKGGHADAEDDIRLVRACVFGAGMAPAQSTAAIHLVDLHRALADSLGLVPSAGAVGRPWAFALAHPEQRATIVAASWLRYSAAFFFVAMGFVVTWFCARRSWLLWPWWVVIAYGGLLMVCGTITLSNPVVYPPLGLSMAQSFGPGLIVLMAQFIVALRRRSNALALGAMLSLPAGLLIAAAVLCGAAQNGIGLLSEPPLMPLWSAQVSALLTMLCCASLALALVLALSFAFRRR